MEKGAQMPLLCQAAAPLFAVCPAALSTARAPSACPQGGAEPPGVLKAPGEPGRNTPALPKVGSAFPRQCSQVNTETLTSYKN